LINLLHGDCLELMKDIPDNSIDMVLTDPPYGTTQCKWDTIIDFDLMWEQLKRVTKDNGAICLFGSEPFSSHLRMSNIKMFKYDWVWQKNKGGNMFNAKFEPMKIHEIISVFYQTRPVYNPIREPRAPSGEKRIKSRHINGATKDILGKSKVAIRSYPELKYPTTVKKFNVDVGKKRSHPTQKPVDLLEYLIKTYTLENETVLDFTMGSGSTGVACKNLNRKFIGIEKDEKYFQIAKARINE
jgi:DNA modification methylase